MTVEENIYRFYSVLVVDNDGENLEAFRLAFRNVFLVITAGSAEEGLKKLVDPENEVAVVVAEQRLPGGGMDLLAAALEKRPDAVGIIMSSPEDSEAVVAALSKGIVCRHVPKPWKAEDMEVVLKDGIRHYHNVISSRKKTENLKAIVDYLRKEMGRSDEFDGLLAKCKGLEETVGQVRQVAGAVGNVLLRGEAGSGRETIAEAMHNLSSRAGNTFIKMNVSSCAPADLEKELFGVEEPDGKGNTRVIPGRLELAHESTLLLSGVADLPQDAQVRLIRALGEKEFERLGGDETIRVDVRVIAATAADLEKLVTKRLFREELLRLFDSFTIVVPPLRDRKEDIPVSTLYYLNKYCRRFGIRQAEVVQEAMARLQDYHWPGNLKELESAAMRAVLTAGEGPISAESFGFYSYRTETAPETQTEPAMEKISIGPQTDNLHKKLEEIEKIEIEDALKRAAGHKTKAANLLGINRSTMYYRMKKYGIKGG